MDLESVDVCDELVALQTAINSPTVSPEYRMDVVRSCLQLYGHSIPNLRFAPRSVPHMLYAVIAHTFNSLNGVSMPPLQFKLHADIIRAPHPNFCTVTFVVSRSRLFTAFGRMDDHELLLVKLSGKILHWMVPEIAERRFNLWCSEDSLQFLVPDFCQDLQEPPQEVLNWRSRLQSQYNFNPTGDRVIEAIKLFEAAVSNKTPSAKLNFSTISLSSALNLFVDACLNSAQHLTYNSKVFIVFCLIGNCH
jgi:hypothetical protein